VREILLKPISACLLKGKGVSESNGLSASSDTGRANRKRKHTKSFGRERRGLHVRWGRRKHYLAYYSIDLLPLYKRKDGQKKRNAGVPCRFLARKEAPGARDWLLLGEEYEENLRRTGVGKNRRGCGPGGGLITPYQPVPNLYREDWRLERGL